MSEQIQVARLFDGIHPDAGPYFSAARERVADEAERARLAGFLAGGAGLLHTTARDRDRLDTRLGRRVPMGFRTDGVWVWSTGLGYYLLRHEMAPDPDFYRYIRVRGYRCQTPDHARVLAVLEIFNATR
jgi:hypothetical protein